MGGCCRGGAPCGTLLLGHMTLLHTPGCWYPLHTHGAQSLSCTFRWSENLNFLTLEMCSVAA